MEYKTIEQSPERLNAAGRPSVRIDRSQELSQITFESGFNAAEPFINRHIDEGRGDKVAIRTHDETVTYRELYTRVNRFGNALKKFGLNQGDRILMVIKDSPEFFYVFWGAVKAGFIPVSVNTILRSKDYQFFIEDSECAVVVYSFDFANEVESAIEFADHKPIQKIKIGRESDEFKLLLESASLELESVPSGPEEDCFIVYSSGSTGTPKGVVHCHRDMVITSERTGVGVLGIRESDIFYSVAKLFFAYGIGNGLSFPLWVGGTSILYDQKPSPESIFNIIKKFQPTIYFGVPTIYAAKLKEIENHDTDFTSLRVCVSAGEALPPDLFNRWKALTGLNILDGIGSTENLSHFISNSPNAIRLGSSGIPVPGYFAKIVDNEGNEVPTGEIGSLWIKGESVAKRYWKRPDKTTETFVDGWLYTGDVYYQDEEGYYFYCGRNDDMLKVGGIWCSPFEIESKLIEHPKVLEAGVIGHPDENNLIKPKAFIKLVDTNNNNELLAEELRKHCQEGLAPYKYPRWFEFVDELPKTATGKIQRFKLRE